jgi:hypothetical protein
VGGERLNYYNYFTEIEEHFVRRRGKHLLISPMDWGLISAWKDAGIPLEVALRGIDIAMDGFFSRQQRASAKINSLCYCHDSVIQAYESYLEARVGESRSDPEAEPGDEGAGSAPDSRTETETKETLDYVSGIIEEIRALAAKQVPGDAILEGLMRVQERLESMIPPPGPGKGVDMEAMERDLGMADALLVETLLALVPEEETAEWEKEARSELKVYRKKLPKEMYLKIRESFLRSKVHHKFNIREFSLFRL